MIPTQEVRSILVVDCDGSLTEAAVPVLRARGYQILRATDASGALWILRHTAIDLVIVDNCVADAGELLAIKAADPILSEIRLVLVTVGATEMAPMHGLVHEAVTPATH